MYQRGLLVAAAAAGALMTSLPAAAATLLHDISFADGAVTDTAGGATGTLLNGASVSGGALNLDGSLDQYVQFSSDLIPTSDYTVVIRVQEAAYDTGTAEFVSQGESVNQGGLAFYIGHEWYRGIPEQIRLGDVFAESPYWGNLVSYPTDDAYHTYVVTSSDSGTTLSIDGTTVFSSWMQDDFSDVGDFTRLGSQVGTYGEYLTGSISNFAVFSGSATAEDISGALAPAAVPEPAALPIIGTVAALAVLRRKPHARCGRPGPAV